jgi:hypothetical protein
MVRAGQDLDRRAHTMRIARVQPERLLDELAHRRQPSVTGKRQPVGDPAFLSQEADELAGESRIGALLEDDGVDEPTVDDKRLAVRAVGPVDGHGIPVVVVGTRLTQRGGDRKRGVRGHHHCLRKERLVVAGARPGR